MPRAVARLVARPVAHAAAPALLAGALAASGAAPAQDVVEIDAPALHGAWLVPADPARASDPPRTTAHLVVLAGERDNAGPAGLAHYAEHLAWHSMARRGAVLDGDVDTNASTDLLATAYRLDGPAPELDRTLATLALALEPIELPTPFARDELGIVEREYDLRVRENVELGLRLEGARLAHGNRWPARPVAGTPESLARLTPGLAKAWHARTHRPGNAVLVVHGAHAPDDVAAAVARAFGDAPADGAGGGSGSGPGDGPIVPPAYVPGPPGHETVERVEPRLETPALVQSRLATLDGPIEPVALDARLAVLHGALDSTRPGGLAGPLRFDDFVAAAYALDLVALDARHLELRFRARPDRGVALGTLRERYEAALAGTARDGLPALSVERARAVLLDRLDALERPDEAVLEATLSAVARRVPPVSNAAWRAHLEAVTPEAANALLDALADAPRTVTVLFEPGEIP